MQQNKKSTSNQKIQTCNADEMMYPTDEESTYVNKNTIFEILQAKDNQVTRYKNNHSTHIFITPTTPEKFVYREYSPTKIIRVGRSVYMQSTHLKNQYR